MHLGAVSTVFFKRSFRDACQRMNELGLSAIEIGTGGYFPKNHCDPATLLQDKSALEKFQETLQQFELTISAFAIHGDPLHPNPTISQPYLQDFRDTCRV